MNVAVQDIASGLARHFSTRIVEVAELPLDPDPVKSVNLISLLGHYYSGQYEKALTYAMKTLAQQPHDELGLYWLARSFLDCGLEDHALLAFQDFLEHFPDSPKAEEAKYRVEELQNKGYRWSTNSCRSTSDIPGSIVEMEGELRAGPSGARGSNSPVRAFDCGCRGIEHQ